MRSFKRLFRWTIIVALLLAGIVAAAAVLIQHQLSGILQNYVRSELGWSLKIGSAQIQFSPLSVRLENIELSAPGKEPFFEASSVSAALPYSSIWGEEVLVQLVSIESPEINLDLLQERAAAQKESRGKSRSFLIQDVKVRSAEVQFKGNKFDHINVGAKIDSHGIEVKELNARFKSLKIKTQGILKDRENPLLEISYEVSGNIAELVSLFPSAVGLEGPLHIRGSIQGEFLKPVISGQIENTTLTFNGSESFSGTATYKYDLKQEQHPIDVDATWSGAPVELARVYWKDMPQIASLSRGVLHYSGNTDIWKGEGEFSVLLAGGAVRPSDRRVPLSGEIHGLLQNESIDIDRSDLLIFSSRLNANGTFNQHRLNMKAAFESSRLKDLAFWEPWLGSIPGHYNANVQFAGSYNDISVIGELTGRSGNSRIRARGVTSTGNRSISAQIGANASAEDLKAIIPDLDQGDFQFEGTIGGNWTSPAVNVSLIGTGLQAGKIHMEQLTAEVEAQGNRLWFHAEAPAYQLFADGSYRLDTGAYEMVGSAVETSAQDITSALGKESIQVRGPVNASFHATGNIKRWRDSIGMFKMSAPDLKWKEVSVSLPAVEIQLEKRLARINLQADAPNVKLDVNGTASLLNEHPLNLRVQGKIGAGIVEKISHDWKGEGDLNLDALILGTASHPELEGELKTENLNMTYVPRDLSIRVERAGAKFSREKIDLAGKGNFNGSAFAWNGAIPLKKSTGNLHFEILDLPLSVLTSSKDTSGNLDVVADLEGQGFPLDEWKPGTKAQMPFHEWSGSISVTPAGLKLGNNVLTVEKPFALLLQDRILRMSSARITSGDLLDFQVSGSLNLDTGEIESHTHLDTKIDLLSTLRADIQSSGPLTADLHLTGTFQKPEYQGKIQLTNATLRIPDTPLFLEQLNLLAVLGKDRILLEKLEARSGGGIITGGGELVTGSTGSHVWFQGKNVATNYPEGLRSQADFDLKLSALNSAVLLSGDVNVLRSFYERELNLRNPIVRQLLASSKELSAEKQFKNRLKFALNVRTTHDLLIKNSLANLLAGGDLKLEGTLYRPRFTGRLSVREGSRIFLMGNQYDVEKAIIDFYGSELLEPNLDVTLSALLRDFNTDIFYEVTVPFGGSTSHIEFKNPRSNPSLSEDQIYALLTQGTVETAEAGTGSIVFQRQILSFLAGHALGAPGAAVAKSIGLSRIQVQQEGLSSVNDPKTRLMLGKDIGAGFSLIYSFVLNDPQDQTWIASYRHGRNIVARFIDQDDGSYTTSISHRIPFGKGPASPELRFSESRRKDRGPRIASIVLKNDSPLTERQILQTLKTPAGDSYDYWTFQDRADNLKKELQLMGYLSPSVDVRENEDEKDVVSLTIEIRAGDPGEMVFTGYDVNANQMNHFKTTWRQGISPAISQQLIREKLLQQSYLAGHYQATVNTRVEQGIKGTIYYFETVTGPRFQSVELRFTGAGHYDPRTLQRDLIDLYGSSGIMFVDALRNFSSFKEKVKSLYVQHGYLRAEVSSGPVLAQPDDGRIVREVRILEGTISRIAAVTAAEGQSFPDSLLSMREGKTFNPDGFIEDELNIRGFYESEGYQETSVRYNIEFHENTPDLLVRWVVSTGPIARIAAIRITGNVTTRTGLIRKQIGLKEGDLLTQHNRSLARKRLSDLGVFQQVTLDTEETNVRGSYDVVVRVTESRKYEFQYGGRYNTDDQLGAEIRLSDFNFLGRAQNLSLYVRSTQDLPLFRLDYVMPVTGSFWDRTRFSLFRDERDEDIEATISQKLEKFPFSLKQLTAQVQQDYRLRNRYRLIWGFEYGAVTAEFQDPESLEPVQFQGTEGVFSVSLVVDRRDDPLNAQRGYFYSVNAEFAPTIFGSDISYSSNYDQIFFYKKFGKFVSATGLRAGFLKLRSNILTAGQKFRTGGSTTMRGFGLNTVVAGDDPISLFFGGDSLFILNQEIRYPIYKWLSGAAFYDGGNVYLPASDFDPFDLRHSAGFGIRAGSGGFTLRFDVGFNLSQTGDEPRSVFHFGIGQAF